MNGIYFFKSILFEFWNGIVIWKNKLVFKGIVKKLYSFDFEELLWIRYKLVIYVVIFCYYLFLGMVRKEIFYIIIFLV